MKGDLIFWPVLVLILMTLLIFVRLLRVKIREIRAGRVDKERRMLHEDAWPDTVLQVNNNIRNQFQLPVLFYVLCFALWALEAVGIVALVAAWLFVATRLWHAYVHLGKNVMRDRKWSFTIGWMIVMFMVGLVAWRLAGWAII